MLNIFSYRGEFGDKGDWRTGTKTQYRHPQVPNSKGNEASSSNCVLEIWK